MFESFISKHIRFNTVGEKGEKLVSPPAIRMAIIGMALGLAVMILSVAIVVGFKKEVSNKITGFGSHVQISNFDGNTSLETRPIAVSDSMMTVIRNLPGVKHAECFATKPGILKTNDDSQGIVLKGVDERYDWTFFRKNLVEGDILQVTPGDTSNSVVISQSLADKLRLKNGDSFLTYFFQDEIRVRKFKITGIYQTNFSDFDRLFILTDIKQIQWLNQWESDMVSGVEISIHDFGRLEQMTDMLFETFGYRQDRLGNTYFIRSIKQLYPMFFSWLDLLDMDVIVILILMSAVAGFTIISGLLIIILERTNMIGILKTLGANNTSVREIFLRISFFLVLKGLLWGNVIALSICFLQKYVGFLKLNPKDYYLSVVPIELNVWHIVLLNVCTLIITMLMLIGPSYIIAKISPAKTIRFE